MASPYPIRPVTEDDLLAVSAVHEHAFHTGPPSGQVRERWDAQMEYERTFAALDGSTIVGTAGSYGFRMRVPGALAAVAGVTLVGVLPTHRRGGGIRRHLRADHRPGRYHAAGAGAGAAYLGGTRLGPLAGAGLVAELRPGALASLSAALSWDPAPWCPMMF
jgi:hypothetical protein